VRVGIGVDVGLGDEDGDEVLGVADGVVFGRVVGLEDGAATWVDTTGTGVGEDFLVGTGDAVVTLAVPDDWLTWGDGAGLRPECVPAAVPPISDADRASVRKPPAAPPR